MNQPAPIALIVYARPDHTRRTLESLRNNTLADQSELYVFADGPKPDASEETQAAIAEVRRVIVNIFGVTGYASPTKRQMPASYFLPVFSSWGWGTWKRAWDTFTYDPKALYEAISDLPEEKQEEFDFGKMPNRGMLRDIISHGKTTFLYPGQSLVQNIGHDGSGNNCIPQEEFYSSVKAKDFQPIEKIASKLERKWVNAVARARRENHKPTLQTRATRRIKRIFSL